VKRFLTMSGSATIAATLLVVLLAVADPVAPVVLKTTEFGHGSTVVLLHALGSGRMVWMPTAKKLLATHRVVLVDLPGHGDSALPDPFTLEACAEALDQVLAKQKPDSTVLVAHGMGGLIALKEVQAHPERVRGLVVIDGSTRSMMKIPEQQQQYFFQMLDTRYEDMLKMMMARQGRDTTQGLELYAQAQQVPAATIKAYLKAAINADASSALKDMKPAFLFVGSQKMWPDTTAWATLAKQLGYDEAGPIATHRIKDSAALIMKDQPDSLAAVIDEFTARALATKKK
jgi:pimeloyl-ACP methyl ester carboxylesterase